MSHPRKTTASPASRRAAKRAAKAQSRERHPFQITGRTGWKAEYVYNDGKTKRLTFGTKEEAQAWLDKQVELESEAKAPLLGGPTRVTLGEFLGEYAMRISIGKQSYKSEVDRINHYVRAIDAPRLVIIKDASGKRELIQSDDTAELPSAFKAHLDGRMSQRERTYACIARLANMTVADIGTEDIRELMTTGTTEGWSDSTIQKEIALLKAAFNTAINEWRWRDFENPCMGLKLGKSVRRFVVVTPRQMKDLVLALSQCDNPQFWPMFDVALHSLWRLGSLLSARWSQTDLANRRARVWAKGKWIDAELPPRVVAILQTLPRGESDYIFTMTPNAVDLAWDGVRQKAGLPALRWSDLRHVGATAYAKAGLNAHELKILLGHTSTRMAEVYVNLANSDVAEKLERVASVIDGLSPMPQLTLATGKAKHARKRKPAAPSNVFNLEEARGRIEVRTADGVDHGIVVSTGRAAN